MILANFINLSLNHIFLMNNKLIKMILSIIKNIKLFLIMEDTNIYKPLHVGHMRTLNIMYKPL